MKNIVILGATGSIGLSTLDIIARHRENFRVLALTAHKNIDRLYDLCALHRPEYAVVADEASAKLLQQRLQKINLTIEVLIGNAGLETVASLPQADIVMAAIVGAVGLLPTLAAAKAGKRVLLANKEALVMAGALFMKEVRDHNATLLPIDSEHNAIFQCLPTDFKMGERNAKIARILLTASGGAFRELPLTDLPNVTPAQAITHPNWNMGPKITVDCATMMNKGLEVIEAHWLFGLPADQIKVLLHPQSTVHSLVEYKDGSTLAHLGCSDMRVPIAHALAWPERIASGVNNLDLLTLGKLDFAVLDTERYPCLNLAYQALQTGGTAPTILNAANEIAVQAFLDGKMAFTDIAITVDKVLNKLPSRPATNLDIILQDNAAARECAQLLNRHP